MKGGFALSSRHAEFISASHRTSELLGVYIASGVLKQVQHDNYLSWFDFLSECHVNTYLPAIFNRYRIGTHEL